MSETVGFLQNPATKKYFLISGGVIGVYFVYKYFKAKSSSTSSGAVTSDSNTATDSTIDPATGIAYSEEASYTGITSGGAIGQNFDAATGTYGVDPNALRQELGDLGYSSNSGQATATTANPIASSLFAPTADPSAVKGYIQLPTGEGYQIQSDGSLFGLTYDQWVALGTPKFTQVTSIPTGGGYNTSTDVNAANAKLAAAQTAATTTS